MPDEIRSAPPYIHPLDGAPVASEAPALSGPPVATDLAPAWVPESPEGPVLRLLIATQAEIVEATGGLSGSPHDANLAATATLSLNRATIDLGAPRPLTRIRFVKANSAAATQLMIQLGGSWLTPQTAGGVNFASYNSGTLFPELVTSKVLLSNASSVSDVESITHPTHVTLRATDGGVPFFFHRGELRPGGARVPDFAQQLNLALQNCEPDGGVYSLDLVARTETFGEVAMPSAHIVSRAAHNSLDSLSFDDRTRVLLPGADPPAIFALAVPPNLTLPAGRPAVAAVELALFARGRGPASVATDGRRGAVVSARFQVAQATSTSEATVAVAAVHLHLLRRTPQATLTLELRADTEGEPRGTLLASASQSADALAEDAFRWLRVDFEEPATVPAGSRLWIVLETEGGEVEWRGADVPRGGAAALFSTDRGNNWQPHPLAANHVLELSLAAIGSPPTVTLGVGGEEQSVLYDPAASPVVLDADSPLVRGINQAIANTTGSTVGAALPAEIPLTLESDATLPLQITLTRLDVVYTQTLELGPQ